MSRAYDAKQAALSAYPADREGAVDAFLFTLNTCREEFELDYPGEGQTPEEYLYGPDPQDPDTFDWDSLGHLEE